NDVETALSVLKELEQVQIPPHPMVTRNLSQLKTYLQMLFAHREAARAAADETARLCESAGDVWGQIEVAWIRADNLSTLGRLDEAVSIARQAIPLAERIGHWGSACFCKWFIYDERLAAGDLAGAAELAHVLDEYDRLHFVPWGVVGK